MHFYSRDLRGGERVEFGLENDARLWAWARQFSQLIRRTHCLVTHRSLYGLLRRVLPSGQEFQLKYKGMPHS